MTIALLIAGIALFGLGILAYGLYTWYRNNIAVSPRPPRGAGGGSSSGPADHSYSPAYSAGPASTSYDSAPSGDSSGWGGMGGGGGSWDSSSSSSGDSGSSSSDSGSSSSSE